jgi:hypothetical protein
MIAALEPIAEREADNIDLTDLYAELESLERRVIVQIQHIQQIKLETDGEAYQPGEKLEEVEVEPTQGDMTEANLLEKEVEQQLSDETIELKFSARCQANATEEENDMGDQDDLPTDKKEDLQQRRLHKKSQPLEQLERVIKEIRKIMLTSTEEVSKGELNRREPAITTRKKQKRKNK